MKKTLLTLSLIIAVITVNAQALLYEAFDYNVNDSLTLHGWTGVNGGDSIVVVAGNLDYTGLIQSVGNKISFGGYGRDYQHTITSQTTGTVYMSFILNVTNVDADSTGGYFTGFGSSATTFGSTVWTKKNGTGFNIGLNAKSTLAYTTWSTDVYTTNTPIFIVVSYEIVSGTINDVVKMWINPLSTTLGGVTAPAHTITITNGAADLTAIDRIFVRQDSPAETPVLDMDEIRVGLSWADVTPATTGINELNAFEANIYPNPASEYFTISAKEQIATIQIFDLQGRMVKEITNIVSNETQTDISELSNGFYSVVAISKNGNIFNTKLIK